MSEEKSNKEHVWEILKEMLPIDEKSEIFQLWSAIARIFYILDPLIQKYPEIFEKEGFVKECEDYSKEYLIKRFPHHFKSEKKGEK